MRIPLGLVGVAALAACGPDPRAPFVGTYATSAVYQTTSGSGTTTLTLTGTLKVTEQPDRTRIRLDDGACPFTAVVNGNSFTVDPGPNCSIQDVSPTGATCTTAISVGSGAGSRSPGAISYQLTGSERTTCNDGSASTGSEVESIIGSL